MSGDVVALLEEVVDTGLCSVRLEVPSAAIELGDGSELVGLVDGIFRFVRGLEH